jgi:hypothetical protein
MRLFVVAATVRLASAGLSIAIPAAANILRLA